MTMMVVTVMVIVMEGLMIRVVGLARSVDARASRQEDCAAVRALAAGRPDEPAVLPFLPARTREAWTACRQTINE